MVLDVRLAVARRELSLDGDVEALLARQRVFVRARARGVRRSIPTRFGKLSK